MGVMLTQAGYDRLTNELRHLVSVDRPKAYQFVEDTRPIGIVEDNPEYIQAIAEQNKIEKKINDLTELLSQSIIFSKCMCRENIVSFGATVEIIDLESDEIKHYTIVSSYESDIPNGLISIQSPFVKNILGMTVGDEFDFNDREYIINDINYQILEG